ncbi:transmembrane protein, putative (macronuclear) [Tetrahymena thermophila SB210]|uniref:Transmembrane protein, putative n=1 Tax=Tetrahymena thermophila (strain SB210) TaxID=312017 RepID=I7MDG8_TETTS|nr:transmembrane protein, putative [Tetrahymena thermophila SB210]EAR87557.1 transmembrane protein, putative [Tetrahymena thermophila SB210]|eukprot:XP_001007802.1 transmembrane protein, putative [Tetrahymena thermophila SB210]
MNKIYILTLIAVLMVAITSATPLPPHWPNVFAKDFVEISTKGNQTLADVGTYYYNFAENTQLLTRSNGQFDFFCGFNDEPLACDQIIVENNRYVYFPEQDSCCYCCGQDQGCSVLKPDWFIDPEYHGQQEYSGVQAYWWVIYEQPDQKGPNYYIETTEENPIDRKPLHLARNNYELNFVSDSYRTQFPQITLPTACKATNLGKCPGVCAKIRGDSVTEF